MLSYEGAVNMVDDSVVMAMAGLGFYSHGDPYNAAIIAGKLVTMCYQFYVEGFMFQDQGNSYMNYYYPPTEDDFVSFPPEFSLLPSPNALILPECVPWVGGRMSKGAWPLAKRSCRSEELIYMPVSLSMKSTEVY